MSTVLNGSYSGKVKSAHWYTFERDGKTLPYLSFDVDIGEATVKPALYFDNEIKTTGMDQGKSNLQVALELLESYGVECDPVQPTKCNPGAFAEAMEGVQVNVFCKVTDDGKQRCYLNKKSREAATPDAVNAAWAELTGKAPTTTAAARKPKAADKPKQAEAPKDDDDLAF